MKQVGKIMLFFLPLFFVGCKKGEVVHPYSNISYDYYDSLRQSKYAINAAKVRWYIDSLRLVTQDTVYCDIYVDKYYASGNPYIWIDMHGSDSRADSLSQILSTIDSDAVRKATVFQPQLHKALNALRNFDFSNGRNINLCLAEIEYYSTKGLVRYACGLRYGFINPGKLLNNLDKENPDDTLDTRCRTLYDVPTESAGKNYLEKIIGWARSHELKDKLSEVHNLNPNYLKLREEYSRKGLSKEQRMKIAVNMERYRWRTDRTGKKYVWINLPEFILRAIDEESGETLEMKICEGSREHKTPLLTSNIERVELNPVWTVPQSIIKREIAPNHAGDAEYFEKRKMKIIDKNSGDEVPPALASADMLKSGNFAVVQNKGEGNALGRMIFRFNNSFAIFLHDTPNHSAFDGSYRAVSHGCIRLEKPFELAVFLLDDKDPLTIDKMRVAVDLPPITPEGIDYAHSQHKPMGYHTYKPSVPLYITYFTAYASANGKITYTPDPYGYDNIIFSLLQSY